MNHPGTPVVLDTDIGTDIDDTWALAMLLRCPELDLRLVVTGTGDTDYRARLAGTILTAAGRADIPLALGPPTILWDGLSGPIAGRPLAAEADAYDLSAHPGGVRSDGVEALVECIMESSEPVTLLAIGPMTNVAAALALEPRIASRARVVAMLGSINSGHFDKLGWVPEYNVVADVPACRDVLAADWEVTFTPLDTCGSIRLEGEHYQRMLHSGDPAIEAVLRSYREWGDAISADLDDDVPPEFFSPGAAEHRSTVLFDTVAVYLAYDESMLEIEELPIVVADDGSTRVSDDGAPARVAIRWRDGGFAEHLADRLLGSASA